MGRIILNLTPLLDLLLILLFAHQINAWIISARVRSEAERKTASLVELLSQKERKLSEAEAALKRMRELERRLAEMEREPAAAREALARVRALGKAMEIRTVRLESDDLLVLAAGPDGAEEISLRGGDPASALAKGFAGLPEPRRDTVVFFSWGDVLVATRDSVREALRALLDTMEERYAGLRFYLVEEGFDGEH